MPSMAHVAGKGEVMPPPQFELGDSSTSPPVQAPVTSPHRQSVQLRVSATPVSKTTGEEVASYGLGQDPPLDAPLL